MLSPVEFDLTQKNIDNYLSHTERLLELESFMDPLLFSSLGLLFLGITTTALIYWFGAHKIAGTREYPTALCWTLAFALFICTFLGAAPFLVEQAIWLLLLPFFGLALSLFSIQRIVLNAAATNENHQQG